MNSSPHSLPTNHIKNGTKNTKTGAKNEPLNPCTWNHCFYPQNPLSLFLGLDLLIPISYVPYNSYSNEKNQKWAVVELNESKIKFAHRWTKFVNRKLFFVLIESWITIIWDFVISKHTIGNWAGNEHLNPKK